MLFVSRKNICKYIFVAIVTPNNTHYPIASSALKNGFHVLSDKPATLTLHEAKEFLAHLKLKAGLPADYWSDKVKLYRYTVSKWKENDLTQTKIMPIEHDSEATT